MPATTSGPRVTGVAPPAMQVVRSVSALGDGLDTGDQLAPLICLTLDGVAVATRSSQGGHWLRDENLGLFCYLISKYAKSGRHGID
jgi:hypothetical protein